METQEECKKIPKNKQALKKFTLALDEKLL
jgi:hypothetical protein